MGGEEHMEPYERLGVALELRQLSQGQLAHKANRAESIIHLSVH